MKISVVSNVDAARRRLKNYQKRQLPTAVTRALNRTLRGAATDTKRLIGKRINLPLGKIAKEIKKFPATTKGGGKRFVARLHVSGARKRPNIASFRGTRQIKGGVVGKPWRTRVKYGKRSFIWTRTAASGNEASTAFHRIEGTKKVPSKGRYAGTKAKREEIKPLFGESIVGTFIQRTGRTRGVKQTLRRTIPRRFNLELSRQLARIT